MNGVFMHLLGCFGIVDPWLTVNAHDGGSNHGAFLLLDRTFWMSFLNCFRKLWSSATVMTHERFIQARVPCSMMKRTNHMYWYGFILFVHKTKPWSPVSTLIYSPLLTSTILWPQGVVRCCWPLSWHDCFARTRKKRSSSGGIVCGGGCRFVSLISGFNWHIACSITLELRICQGSNLWMCDKKKLAKALFWNLKWCKWWKFRRWLHLSLISKSQIEKVIDGDSTHLHLRRGIEWTAQTTRKSSAMNHNSNVVIFAAVK